MSEISQSDLILRCKGNEAKAQLELYDKYCKAMYATACNFIKDDVIAQDIMQEAFMKAFKKIESYTGKASFGAWLKRIVINQSLDWLKKQKLDVIELNDEVISMIDDDDDEWEVDIKIDLKTIYNCIEQLPQKCKNVVKLYLLEGYDHQEVAQILQISEVASRSQLSRGKNRLKELLNRVDYEN